jgi:hypothetical protein
MTVINMRGSHGSGKTYVSHTLIDNYLKNELLEPEYVREKHFVKTNCFELDGNLRILGRYRSGMDGIFPQEIVEDIIRYWTKPDNFVIWENVMVSANVGRWCTLSHELEPVSHNIWAFFDTPLELCIERVFSRRAETAGRGFNHRQEDSEVKLDVLAQHWRRCRRAAVRAVEEGIDVRWVDHRHSYEQVFYMLKNEGWSPESLKEPDRPELDLVRWNPTAEEKEYVLKTAILPWEPEDTQTKVDFVSPPRASKGDINDQLGTRVLKWGWDVEETSELDTTVQAWKSAPDTVKDALKLTPSDKI